MTALERAGADVRGLSTPHRLNVLEMIFLNYCSWADGIDGPTTHGDWRASVRWCHRRGLWIRQEVCWLLMMRIRAVIQFTLLSKQQPKERTLIALPLTSFPSPSSLSNHEILSPKVLDSPIFKTAPQHKLQQARPLCDQHCGICWKNPLPLPLPFEESDPDDEEDAERLSEAETVAHESARRVHVAEGWKYGAAEGEMNAPQVPRGDGVDLGSLERTNNDNCDGIADLTLEDKSTVVDSTK
jgi:hypothetical protein